MLHLPCIHLDRFYWQPGWREASSEEFRASVSAALDEDPRGWIVDGNYTQYFGSMVSDEATDVICKPRCSVYVSARLPFGPGSYSRDLLPPLPGLDPPLILYFPRLLYRTFLRLFRLAPPCSSGCEERASEVFFSRESIIWWYVAAHALPLSAAPRVPVVRSFP